MDRDFDYNLKIAEYSLRFSRAIYLLFGVGALILAPFK